MFRNDFLKRFQGIAEDEFFSKLTKLQQVRSVEEFTHQWESLSTRVFGLYDKQRLEIYLGGLKPYLQKELTMHDIPNIEVARHKAKVTERKLEGIKKRGDNHYRQEKENNVGILQILGHSVINATNLNHMPMKWKVDRSQLTVTLIIEKRRKTYVVDAVMIGPLVINVGIMRQYNAKSSMERKCKSFHKRPRSILIPTLS